MPNDYLYIIGKSDPQSTTITAIKAAGYKVGILADSQLSLQHPELYDRIESVDYANIDAELPRLKALNLSILGLLCTYENYIVAKAKIGTYFNLPVQSIESAKLSTDKSLMREAFLTADRSISPDYRPVHNLREALEFANSHNYPLIIKPTNLVKSLLVLKCDDEQQLIDRFTYANDTIGDLYEQYNIYDREPQLIIEEFIIGQQYSIAAFVDGDGRPHFCDGIVRLINAQDIHVDDNYLYSRTLPATLDDGVTKEMYRVAEAGVRALDMKSVPAHIELMYGPGGVKIIEIGARIGGYRPRMYGYCYGIDMIQQEVKLAIGQQPDLNGTLRSYCAAYELFPEQTGAFVEITGNLSARDFAYYRITTASGNQVGPAKNGFKATAIIIVVNDNKAIFEQLCKHVETAKVTVI
jgi:biotin carboxylase